MSESKGKRTKKKLVRRGILLVCGVVLLALIPLLAIGLQASQFDVIDDAANAYLSAGKPANISSKDLMANMLDGDSTNDPFILSIRAPDIYAKGHIPGAVNIPITELFKPENLARLPQDKQIVVYCYTGHIGSRVAALLNLCGYDAVNLKWGMTGWTKDTEVAPYRFDPAKTPMDYPVETKANTPAETYPFPMVNNTPSSLRRDIIRAACYAYTSIRHADISAKGLNELLVDGDPANDPFIVSVRKPEDYAKGHIPGAINIPWREIARKSNLKKLPPDKKIVVYGYTGSTASQAAAILNVLGYNAVNLMWGMTSWTRNKDVAPYEFDSTKSEDYSYETSLTTEHDISVPIPTEKEPEKEPEPSDCGCP